MSTTSLPAPEAMAGLLRLFERIRGTGGTLPLHGLLVGMLWRQRRTLRDVRVRLNACRTACEGECLAGYGAAATTARNALAALVRASEAAVTLAPYRPFLRSALAEWDELAEDCAVASDPEIRGLLCQIADAL